MASSLREATNGYDHDAHHQACAQSIENAQAGNEILQYRRDQRKSKVAVDYGRDAGKHLEHGLSRRRAPECLANSLR